MKGIKASICYLCGNALIEADGNIDDDHIPPKQLYPEDVRRSLRIPMLTIPVHKACNGGFSRDEEYFTLSFVPLASNSSTAKALIDERGKKHVAGKQAKLYPMILQEFEPRPSGVYLPHGIVLKRLDGNRVQKVIWKIVRGLHFFHFNEVVPSETRILRLRIYEPLRTPDEMDLIWLSKVDGKGRHPDIFDYKFEASQDSLAAFYWGLLFWKSIIVTIGYCLETDRSQVSRVGRAAQGQ